MSDLVACESCDLLHEEQPLEDRQDARCVRCAGLLYRGRPRTLEHTLALTLAALALLIVANVYPFLTFTLEGQTQANRIISGVIRLWEAHYEPLALLILWASVLAPLGKILATLYVTAPLLAGFAPPGVAWLTRLQKSLAPWTMLDVYMLAVLATLAKLASMATITPGPGAWAFVALMLVFAGASAAFDDRVVWQRLDAARAPA
jgi:paraquat-inducible protein A